MAILDADGQVPRRATLLWVPGATHDSAAVYRGPMEALASQGYRSVALHLQKSRCTSLGDYVNQAGDIRTSLAGGKWAGQSCSVA